MSYIGICLMALLYLLAGLSHFLKPKMYEYIIPRWIPFRRFLVYFTGLWEMMAAVLLLVPVTRPVAAWSIIILLVLVFPANIKMAIDFKKKRHKYYWLTVLRLPVQVLLVWWAWMYT
ncbi:MAG: DoxX family protein [Chitinophagaceae bacterium]